MAMSSRGCPLAVFKIPGLFSLPFVKGLKVKVIPHTGASCSAILDYIFMAWSCRSLVLRQLGII